MTPLEALSAAAGAAFLSVPGIVALVTCYRISKRQRSLLLDRLGGDSRLMCLVGYLARDLSTNVEQPSGPYSINTGLLALLLASLPSEDERSGMHPLRHELYLLLDATTRTDIARNQLVAKMSCGTVAQDDIEAYQSLSEELGLRIRSTQLVLTQTFYAVRDVPPGVEVVFR